MLTTPSHSTVATALLALLAGAQLAAAHFTLDYPRTRGFDEDIESDNLCGGFHNASATRSPWYYRNGPVQIDSHHDSATVNIYVSFDQNPSSSEAFLKTSSGASIPPLRKDLAITGEGDFCFHANASALAVDGVTIADGTNATVMVEYISLHGHLYQCADVTFISDSSVGSNLTCTDSLRANAVATNTSNAAPTGSSSTGGSTAPAASSGATAKENGAVSSLAASTAAVAAFAVAASCFFVAM